jgi:hypothetical protein
MGRLKTKKKTPPPPKAEIVAGDAGALTPPGDALKSKESRTDAATQVGKVYLQALANLSMYGQEISDACELFKSYCETKITDMDTDDVTKDAVAAVFSKSMDVLKKLVPMGEGLTAAGKVVREGIRDAVFQLMSKPGSLAASGGMSKDKLREVMRGLADEGRALKRKWTSASPGGSKGTTVPVLQKLAQLVTNLENNLRGNAVNAIKHDQEQTEFLDMFYDAATDEVDSFLNYYYAIPKPDSGHYAAFELYKGLLKRFARIYAWSASTKRDKLSSNAGGWGSNIPNLEAKFRSEGEMYWHSH